MSTGKAEAAADQFFFAQEDAWERASRIMAVIYNTRAFGDDSKGATFFNPLRHDPEASIDSGTDEAFALAEAEEQKKRTNG